MVGAFQSSLWLLSREGTVSNQNNEDRNPQSLTTTARIEMHQSQTATVLLIMRHGQATSSTKLLTLSNDQVVNIAKFHVVLLLWTVACAQQYGKA